jgi:hypothetical protein
MDFAAFKDWAFLGVLTGGVYILWQIKTSVDELNVKIAVVINRTDSHEKRIEKLEEKQ